MASKNLTPLQVIADCLGAESLDGIVFGIERLKQFRGATHAILDPYIMKAAALNRDCNALCKAMPMRSHTYRANREIVMRELAAELAAKLGISTS